MGKEGINVGWFIGTMTAILLIAYTVTAVWMISKQSTIGAAAGVSAGFLCGGFIVVPVAAAVAKFLCWAVGIIIVLAFIGAVFAD